MADSNAATGAAKTETPKPAVQPTVEAKVEAQPKAEAKPEAKAPEAKPEAKPQPVAAKVEAKPQPAVKAETKPKAAKPQAKRLPKPALAKAAKAKKPVVKTAKKTIKPAAKAAPVLKTKIAEGTRIMNKQINETIELNREAGRVAADKIQAVFGDVNERAKTAMEKSGRLVEEMTEISRGNVEAIVASSKIAARGVETLSQDVAEFGRKSFEEASATFKSFAEVKSPADLFRMQSEFARAQFDALVAESSKVSEAVIKLAGEVAEPITSRYNVAAERVKAIAL